MPDEQPNDKQPSDKQPINPLLLNTFAISVIIPMYNAEKYVGECLDSLLAQTFQDFEVIIADDCSTDSSCGVVESYMPKFDSGRLSLYHMEKHTAYPGELRNIGLSHARGEYVYFMDADDTLTKTGLEELYTLAKEYDADVVYCERYYMSTGLGEDFIKNICVATRRVQPPPYVEEPKLETEDLFERVQGILKGRFWGTPWLKLIRHNFLDKHKIFFPSLRSSEDDIWTHSLIFFARKFLRVPNMVYICRMHEDSIMGAKRSPQQLMYFWLNPVLIGLKELDKLMSRIEFFKENPQQRYAVLEKEFQGKLRAGFRSAGQLTPADVYEMIKEEFGKYLGDYDTLVSALCSQIFGRDKTLKETQQKAEKHLAEKELEIKRLKDSMSYILEFRQTCPDVSVVIPMYNAEQYIGECLDSLLAQTFTNFEVIVVDDCSTDNSVEVVESYVPKFNGQLRLQKLETNSGTAGAVGRNVGFKLVRGDYVFFVDADDYLAKSALKTFYTAAKKYDADVVYTSAYNLLNAQNKSKVLRDGINKKLEDKLTLIENDPNKNLQQFDLERAFNFPWTYLVKRDFLARNQIEFPAIPNGVDHLWVLQVHCYSKRFLRIADALYFYRRHQSDSISTTKREPREQVSYWISSFASWLKALGDISNRIKILKDNPVYVLAAAERHFNWCLSCISEARENLTDRDIYEILYSEFAKTNVSSELTVPFFFSIIDAQQRELKNKKEKESLIPSNFDPFIAARIEVKLIAKTSESEIKIFSVSDENADISKPKGLKENLTAYHIKSRAGKLSFTTKVFNEGQISLNLRGANIKDPEDNSKHIPYWIDYTKLTINDKVIFDTITPAWYKEPYRYNMKVKAGEKVKIKVEWQPHRSDT